MIRYDTDISKELHDKLAAKNAQKEQDTLGRAIGRA